MKNLKIKLESLCIFRELLKDPVISALCAYFENPASSTYAEFAAALYNANGGNLGEYVKELCWNSENVYVKTVGCGKDVPNYMHYALVSELDTLQEVAELNKDTLCASFEHKEFLPDFTTTKLRLKDIYLHRVDNIGKYGYGIYAKNRMFYVNEQNNIVPVHNPDKTELSHLIDYERERQIIIDNTKALLEGKPAANILLTGDAGTGKSSTVKAVANALWGEGLRIIEVRKDQLRAIPKILDELSSNPLKFVMFIDDLSFLKDDDNFNALKAVLEGSVTAKSSNVVIYATSNRRHIIKEKFSDREGDDIHRNDTMQELISLSERFGIHITFSKPSKETFLHIVHHLADKNRIDMPKDELELLAERFALERGGRSARLARQFIDAIDYVKRNITNLVHYYKNGEDPEIWLKKEMGTQAFVDVPDLEFPDFELIIDNDRPASTDIVNIKQMYTNMKDLNDSFASDERLWAGLCHTVFYEYMQSRWGSDLDETKIINNYFLKSTRFYVINGISRLWWYGRKTYSQKFENNFAMLDYMANDLNGYGFTLFGSNWSNSERILSLFFEALFELQSETSRKADRILFNDTIQYTNALCGVYLLDACDDEYIKSKIKAYVLKREKELIVEKENNKINNVRTTGTDRFDNIIKAVNYLGGHGTPKQIFDSVEALTGKKVSLLDKNYISNALKSKNFDGVFIRTKTEKFDGYRVSISYLTKENLSKRKAFVQDCINNLEGTQNMVFNVINAIKKERFTLNEIYAYKQWSRINWEERSVLLDTKIVEYTENGKAVTVPEEQMKNKSSRRTLPLPEPVYEMLIEVKEKQELYRKLFKSSYNRKYHDYVCVDQLGNLIKPSYITSHFSDLLKKYGLRHIRFHDLRHTFASILLGKEVPLINVSNFLGHSDIGTTANIYGHLDTASKKASAAVITDVLCKTKD